MKRIVVFDDDVNIGEIVSCLFDKEKWEVITFTTCIDLIENVTSVDPMIILMDNWIAGGGGIKATQLLKANEFLKNIPVVYISANNEVSKLATEAGADAFIAKPFDIDELEELIISMIVPN